MGFPTLLFPAFFLIVLFAAILPAVITMIYLQVYKRYVNKVFNSDKAHSVMVPPYKMVIILTVAVLFIGVLTSLFVGYKFAYDYFEKDVEDISAPDLQAFYAEVTEVGEHTIAFKGISLNEERYRGEFQYEIWGETSIMRQDEPIALSDLEEGDLISVIFIADQLFKIQLISSSP